MMPCLYLYQGIYWVNSRFGQGIANILGLIFYRTKAIPSIWLQALSQVEQTFGKTFADILPVILFHGDLPKRFSGMLIDIQRTLHFVNDVLYSFLFISADLHQFRYISRHGPGHRIDAGRHAGKICADGETPRSNGLQKHQGPRFSDDGRKNCCVTGRKQVAQFPMG